MKAKRTIIIGMAALLLSSCVKDELYNTPHPDKGAVTISLTGLSADDNYVLDIDGKVADITGSPFTNPDLLNTDDTGQCPRWQEPCGRYICYPPAGLSENH